MYMSTKQMRQEEILNTLDRIKFATRKQLQKIHGLGSDRNALKVLKGMNKLLEINNFQGQNVYSLSKEGKDWIGSECHVKFSYQIEHYLMRNDLFIHYGCPKDWQIETPLFFAPMAGGKEKKITPDARFRSNGIWHFVEVDRTQDMNQNKKKIAEYAELSSIMEVDLKHKPVIVFYTNKPSREEKLREYCKIAKIQCQVYTIRDIL